MKYKKTILASLLLIVILSLGAAWFVQKKIETYLNSPLVDKTLIFTVKQGSNYSVLGSSLVKEGIVPDLFWWKIIGKLNPDLTKIKTGTFEFKNGFSLEDILKEITSGKEFQFKLTLVEGGTFKEWLKMLNQSDGLKKSEMNEQEIISKLQVPHKKMEGLLHPETYYYSNGMSAFSIVKKAYLHQENILNELWIKRDKNLPYKTPYDALIMASIIEKESGYAGDRAKISSVFVNRLRMGMRLQTDPTVIYGMGDRYKGKIRKKDLQKHTIYNTYRIYGLPPTPIAMPSEASIYATLHPDTTKYLYFVSKGNGKSYFSKNLKEHNSAVQKYILGK